MRTWILLLLLYLCPGINTQAQNYKLQEHKDLLLSFSIPKDWATVSSERKTSYTDVFLKKDTTNGGEKMKVTFAFEVKATGTTEQDWIKNTGNNFRANKNFENFKVLDSSEINNYFFKASIPAYWEYSFSHTIKGNEFLVVNYVFFRGDNVAVLQYILLREDVPVLKDEIAKSRDSFTWLPNKVHIKEVGISFDLPYNFNGYYDAEKNSVLLHPHDSLKAAKGQVVVELKREPLDEYENLANFEAAIEAGLEKDNRYSIEERKPDIHFNTKTIANKMLISAFIDDIFYHHETYCFIQGRYIYYYQKLCVDKSKGDYYKELKNLRESMEFEQ